MGWKTLIQPFERGVFDVPDFYLYYLVAQEHYASFWYHPDARLQFLKHEHTQAHPYPLSTILPRGLRRTPGEIHTLQTTALGQIPGG